MDCPVCHVPLIVVERQGIELDYCMKCKGIWFDEDELELLAEALGLQTKLPDIAWLGKAESREKPRDCPRCLKRMEKVYLGKEPQVLIDRCPRSHGLWFDWGELGGVVSQYSRTAASQGAQARGTGEEEVIRFLGEVLAGPRERGQTEAK